MLKENESFKDLSGFSQQAFAAANQWPSLCVARSLAAMCLLCVCVCVCVCVYVCVCKRLCVSV